MPKILLINPEVDAEIAPYDANTRSLPLGKRNLMPPLHLATLTALTPDDFEVDIWDEPVHGRIDETTNLKDYDLVGITSTTVHFIDTKRLARLFKKRGIPVVIGGSGVSATPEYYRDDFDVLFIGEAEHTWEQFLSDWKAGSYKKEYRQITKPDMTNSSLPRWDSIADDMKYYVTGVIQTTRGCPFNCEFCDIVFLYGRQARYKPIDLVIEEVCALERLGVDNIFFCDDNLIGNSRYAKDLLRELIPVNNSFAKPLTYETQISLNVAKDEELLELLADANFLWLFIGIETPNKESLKETNKLQNYKTDILKDIHKIYSYGLPIKSAMVIGFDHDDKDIFDQQFEFIQEACFPVLALNMLRAPVATKLWWRLLKERRLIEVKSDDDIARYEGGVRGYTNIIPKQMTRVELMSGYKDLLERVHDWDRFVERIKSFLSMIKRRPNVTYKQPPGEKARLIFQQYFSGVEDGKARNAIFEIFAYTREQAPFMLRKVFALVFRHAREVELTEVLCQALDEQIALEESIPSIQERIDKSPVLVSEEFREVYREVFPQIYQSVLDGLFDKSLLPGTLVETFTDFLMRFGDTFEWMEKDHLVALQEIADGTIAAKNRTKGQGIAHPGEEVCGKKRMNELRVEVIKSVERDLREFYS